MDGSPKRLICYLCGRPIKLHDTYRDSKVEQLSIHDACCIQAIQEASDLLDNLHCEPHWQVQLEATRAWYQTSYHLPQVKQWA